MTELIGLVSTAALAVSSSWALALAVKATLTLVAALIVARLCVRSRAALRHLVFAAAFGALLLIPLVAAIVPVTIVELPVARSTAPSIVEPTVADSITHDQARAMTMHSAEESATLSIGQVLVSVWIAGVLIFSAPIAIGLFQLGQLRRRSRAWVYGQLVVDMVTANTGLRRRVVLLQHDALPGPLTCGLWEPTILVPTGAAHWNVQALRRALVHEVEHVRRKDWATHCVARVVCALYWFHPLVWVTWRQLRLEAERACDDAVVRREDAREYASLLITCAQRQMAQAGMPMLAMATRGDLSIRVAALLNRRQRRGRVTGACVAATAMVAMVASWGIGTVMFAQSPAVSITRQAEQSFDVVSIKRNISGSQDISINAPNGTAYNVTNVPMRGTIMRAFQVKNLAGMPAWVDDERYDITAKSSGKPDPNEVSAMLRTMLADRLKLKGHVEPREMSVYALVVSRPGHAGLKAVTLDCDAIRSARDAAVKVGQAPALAANGAPPCAYSWFGGAITSGGIPLQMFAGLLDYVAGRVVVDQTGLTGRYEFTLRFTPPGTQPTGDGSTDFFTAIQEQLGLRLEPKRAPVDTFVIDHIERPSDN